MNELAAQIERFARAGVRQTARNLVQATTARQGIAPGAPVATGQLKGSLRLTRNQPSAEEPVERPFYPVMGDAEVDAVMGEFELGDSLHLRWIAKHANIIEGGRRPDKRGRMIGSEQAPDGFVHLGRDEALEQMDRWRYDGR
ncbi:MAG TPA: hypothetical protein DCY40_05975 [Actinobacteria bacterium]|nr:hypothetical protein [Actinomycetota bacterium]